MKTKQSREYGNFDRMMRKVLKVSHSELKAKLDAEKAAKQRKKAKAKTK